jgi:hypothetical protein
MRMADVLRQLADKLEKLDRSSNSRNIHPQVQDVPSEESEQETYLPPLQAKIELLKKGVGVESAYDDEDTLEDTTELDAIKKNAGISPAVIHMASDDEPLDV